MHHNALEAVMPTNLSTKWILLGKLAKDEFKGTTQAEMNVGMRNKLDIHSTLKAMNLRLSEEIVPISILVGLLPVFQPCIKDFGKDLTYP
jgi:hypothetical protein